MQALACSESRFAPANVFAHVRARLTLAPPGDWQGARAAVPRGDLARLRPAAVLAGLAAYPGEVMVSLALRHEEFEGKMRHFDAMPYGTRNIWGVTAGILRNLYERLYS